MRTLRAALCCLAIATVCVPVAQHTYAAARLAPHSAASEATPLAGLWQTLDEMPTPRAQPAAVADTDNRKIYVMGGYTEEDGAPFTTVEVYDPATGAWSPGPSLPVPTRGAAGVYVGGKIYLFGGFTDDDGAIVQVLDVATGVWTVEPFAASSWEMGAAVLDGHIYVAGGDAGSELQLVEVDPATLAATPRADMPIERKAFDLHAANGSLYAVAGVGAGFSAHAQVDGFDPATGEWSTTPADLPEARNSYASAAIGDRIYVAGGSNILFNGRTPRFDTLFVYDVTSGEWSEGPAMPDFVRETAGVALDGTFYVVGGWAGAGASASAFALAAPSGADTPGVYSPSTAAWFLKNSSSPGPGDLAFFYGGVGAFVPLSGDWDGDGDDTPGLYDPATGNFFLRNSSSSGPADVSTFSFGVGNLGYIPIVGDWDGDGDDTVGVYDPATGTFFLKNTNSSGDADLAFTFGIGGGIPLAGDWDGTNDDTVGLYDPVAGAFFLRNSNTSGPADVAPFFLGAPNATPLSGDWDGDGVDSVGVFYSASASWFLKNELTGGAADFAFVYGSSGSAGLTGDWNNQ